MLAPLSVILSKPKKAVKSVSVVPIAPLVQKKVAILLAVAIKKTNNFLYFLPLIDLLNRKNRPLRPVFSVFIDSFKRLFYNNYWSEFSGLDKGNIISVTNYYVVKQTNVNLRQGLLQPSCHIDICRAR